MATQNDQGFKTPGFGSGVEAAKRRREAKGALERGVITEEDFAAFQPGATTVERDVPDFPVQDIPRPEVNQEMDDANFITGIEGKRLGDLSSAEIQRLLEIQGKRSEENLMDSLTGQFTPGITAAQAQADRLAQEKAALTQSEQERVAAEQARAAQLLEQQFAPRFSQLERSGARQQENIQRSFSFAGTGRGTRAQEKRAEALEIQAEREAALAAEQALQQRLINAQIQGESDEVIDSIASQLDTAKNRVVDLENAFAEAQAAAEAQLAELGQGSVAQFLQTLETQAALNQYDPQLSAATGAIVDSQGNPITGPDGTALQPAQGVAEANQFVSQSLGYLATAGGQAITDVEGNPIPINKSVKGTFKDGADNTYILFEDGTTQTVGSRGATGAGGGGLPAGDLGFDPDLAQVYSYLNDPNVDFADRVATAARYDKSVDQLTIEADNWLKYQASQSVGDAAGGPERAGGFIPGAGEFIGGAASTLFTPVSNFLFGQEMVQTSDPMQLRQLADQAYRAGNNRLGDAYIARLNTP